MMNNQTTKTITKKEYLSYGGVFFGQNILYVSISSFLMLYYTNVVGIPAVTVGTVLFISKLWDAINDPLMGIVIDKVHFKNGKFLPWIRFAILFMPLVFFLLFQNPFESEKLKILYILVSYFLFDTIYTLGDTPIFALSTVVSSDINERTSFLSFGRLFAIISSVVPSLFFPLAIKNDNWSLVVGIMALLAFLFMVPIAIFGQERTNQLMNNQQHSQEQTSLLEMAKGLISNKYLVTYLTSFFLLRIFTVSSIANVYFYSYVINKPELITLASLVGLIPGILLGVFQPKLIRRFGKRRLYITLHVISIIAAAASFIIGFENPYLVIALSVFSSFALLASSMMNGLFIGDCIDYGAYQTGKRQEGMFFSLQTFINKAATAVVAMFGGWLLHEIGFVANQAVSFETAQGLFSMITVIPMLGMILSVAVFAIFYQLSEQKLSLMRATEHQVGVASLEGNL